MCASNDPKPGPFRDLLQDPRAWLAVVMLVIALRLLVPQLRNDSARTPRLGDIPDADYICRETQEVFRLRATEAPARNPHTGRATLVPAVYDREAEIWKPGPPLDARQRNRGNGGR